MNNHFIREFVFDEEQQEELCAQYTRLFPSMFRAGVSNRERGNYVSDARYCDHVNFNYLEFPDISYTLIETLADLDQDYPEDLWFAQFEFIRYEGAGQTFLRHQDDNKDGSQHNRLYTSVTMIEKSKDLEGGKLKIWTPCGREYTVDLEPFETIIFPAYYEHEATPLVKGRRVVMISWAQREGRKVLTSQ